MKTIDALIMQSGWTWLRLSVAKDSDGIVRPTQMLPIILEVVFIWLISRTHICFTRNGEAVRRMARIELIDAYGHIQTPVASQLEFSDFTRWKEGGI